MVDERLKQLKNYIKSNIAPELGLSHNADQEERTIYGNIKGRNKAYRDILQELLRLYPELKEGEPAQGAKTPE